MFKLTLMCLTVYSICVTQILSSSEQRSKRQINPNPNNCPFKVSITCDPSYRYHSFDGTCNNLNNPILGKTQTPYKRYLPPAYDDDRDSPRQTSVSGNPLPNPRSVSLAIKPQTQKTEIYDNTFTQLLPVFGQFLTHDLAHLAVSVDGSGKEVACTCTSTDPVCSMAVKVTDSFFNNLNCMPFTRSRVTYAFLNCSTVYREQSNGLSSFIDGTPIYGYNYEISNKLREFTGGRLATSQGIEAPLLTITGRTYLPLASDVCSKKTQRKCFLAGENRTTENLDLVGVHLIFNREHNRIADELARINPSWDDQKLYLETRRIVIAIFQHITYKEWLPPVLGDNLLAPLKTNEYYNGYDATINPSVSNEFTTAAFRFGHTLVKNSRNKYNVCQRKFLGLPLNFTANNWITDPAYDISCGGMNGLLLGQLNDPILQFGSFADSLQNNLFKTATSKLPIDLLTTNINRGRDHGLPSYASYVKMCTGRILATWNDLKSVMTDDKIAALMSVYSNVNDVDLFAGGISETKVQNGVAGPTFVCLMQKQFIELKNGDRFYYENGPDVTASAFTLAQLAEIKKVSMSKLICNNFDIMTVQKNPFLSSSVAGNTIEFCESFTQMDLTKWLNN